MQYILVKWNHTQPDEPISFYVEIDVDRLQHRHLEIYANGNIAYATKELEYGDAFIYDEPYPTLEEINSDEDTTFVAEMISREQFEKIWSESLQKIGHLKC